MTLGRRSFAREGGGIVVIVAVWMASAIALVTFVIDVGHWFEHKRHLQMQVDAGAFAGATMFNGCYGASDPTSASSAENVAIQNAARKFAGDTKNVPTALNAQVNNKANVTVVLNSTKYPGDGGVDYDDPAGPFCQSGFVDVKATDANLPWFFAAKVVPKINAHARVTIQQLATLGGALPLAVEDVNPLAAGALFVNEDAPNFKTTASAVLGTQALTAGSATVLNGLNLVPWTGGPVNVTIPTRAPDSDVGVVIALCSNKNLCGPTKGNAWLSGTVSAVCGQLFVTCMASDQTGLEFIHGYNNSGVGTAIAPILRGVRLTKGASGASCTDDSAPYFLLNAGCKVGAEADIDFGFIGDPSKSVAKGGLGASVSVGGCSLNYVSTTGTTSHWSKSDCITIASGAGEVPLSLVWSTTAGGNHTIPSVARAFANDGPTATQSYPIAYAQLTQGSACSGGVGNSVPFGATDFCVGIGVSGNLKVAADTTDPTRILKFIGGSHTGALDCGWGTGADALRDSIHFGCKTQVQRNPGEACPNTTTPVDCLRIETGGKVGPTRQGMNLRFAPNDVCPANNWSSYPDLPSGDPRVVPLIITLYGAFGGSGSGYVPVTDFAVFYVTGWDGAPSTCSGINEAAPPGAGNGTIWGHFIVYTGDLGNSTGGGICDFNLSSLSPCIPVLTE